MNHKQIHDFLFELYDYADYLVDQIQPNNPDNSSYFLTLVYIEQMFDQYGRGLISRSAREANDAQLDSSVSLSEAHRRIELLRARIRTLADEYDFDETLEMASKKVAREWRKQRS